MRRALLAVLAVLAGAGACSIDIQDAPVEMNPTPPAMTIVGPSDGLFYNAADDEDPATPGIQLTLRVDVDDEAIADVDLAVDGATQSDVVAEDLSGRRAAFFAVTLGSADEHAVVARSLHAEAHAVLRAVP